MFHCFLVCSIYIIKKAVRVLYISLVFWNAHRVLSKSNTQLRLLYLIIKITSSGTGDIQLNISLNIIYIIYRTLIIKYNFIEWFWEMKFYLGLKNFDERRYLHMRFTSVNCFVRIGRRIPLLAYFIVGGLALLAIFPIQATSEYKFWPGGI